MKPWVFANRGDDRAPQEWRWIDWLGRTQNASGGASARKGGEANKGSPGRISHSIDVAQFPTSNRQPYWPVWKGSNKRRFWEQVVWEGACFQVCSRRVEPWWVSRACPIPCRPQHKKQRNGPRGINVLWPKLPTMFLKQVWIQWAVQIETTGSK